VLDTRNRRFTYCNAGHPPAMLLRDGKITELTTDNMVLGVDPNESFRQQFIDLKPNDLLLLYTDGLPDAMNFKDETFGHKRIVEAFAKGGATAETVAQGILWDMRRFVGMTRRTDDVTMIVARIT
jgi:serine phosphatase RsbU (regulator of sigma subunit)